MKTAAESWDGKGLKTGAEKMTDQGTTVTGEAPESDDEDEQGPTSFMQNTMISSSTVVSGEASETDEEDEEDEEKHKGTRHKPETAVVYDHSSHGNLKTEQVAQLDNAETQEAWSEDPRAIKSKGQKIIYKFDSPFHRKLRERNLTLRSDLVEGIANLYKSAQTKLNSSTFHLTRAQQSALDVADNTRFIVEDLDTLCKSMDIILTSEFLPSLHVKPTQVQDGLH